MRKIIASITSAALWTGILIALPFLEESLEKYPSSNDSWQRGMVLIPFVFLLAIFAAHAISKWAVSRGYTSYLNFTLRSSLMSSIVCALALIPFCVVASVVGMIEWSEGLLIGAYGIASVFMACIPAASIWWIIGITAHNNAPQSDASRRWA